MDAFPTSSQSNDSTSNYEVNKFGWEDYTVFGVSLASTLVVGLVFAFVDKWHTQSSESYLMANRSMSFFPVAMSLFASLINAIFIIGITSTAHMFGMEVLLFCGGLILANIFTIFFAIPMYHHMGYSFTSVYEYLERRFSLPVRMIGSMVFVLTVLVYLAVVLYAPSLAFVQVSHISDVNMVILFTGAVCAIYTAFGGIRAVLWTDTVQMLILFGSMIALVIVSVQGLDGGMEQAWTLWTANTSMRHVVDDISGAPWERHTVWTMVFGGGVVWGSVISSNQMMVQRYMTIRSRFKAQIAKLIGALMVISLYILVSIIAIVIHASYPCDPLLSGKLGPNHGIQTPDHLVPFFIMDKVSNFRGFAGLLFAGLYAASLSTVSSAVNSLAAVSLEDFVKPIYRRTKGKELSTRAAGIAARVLGIIYAVLCVLLAMGAVALNQFIFALVVNAYNLMGGPLFGVILLGWLFPWVESVGAVVGLLVSFAMALYLFIGNTLYDSRVGWDFKTLRMECSPEVMMAQPPRAPPSNVIVQPGVFSMSYLWHCPVTLGICMCTGLLVSTVVHIIKICCKKSHGMSTLDKRLLFSCGESCCCCCPDSVVNCANCGLDYGGKGALYYLNGQEEISDKDSPSNIDRFHEKANSQDMQSLNYSTESPNETSYYVNTASDFTSL